MLWTLHGERSIYASPWMNLNLADVELPGGRRIDHHLVRVRPAAGLAAVDDQGRVLLIWRHRFITDGWGWEIPGGRVEDGEDPAATAARELLEETGFLAGPVHPMFVVRPAPGLSDDVHHIFRAEGAERVGEPTDVEAERIEWVPLDAVPAMIAAGEISSGSTVAALLYIISGACGNGDGPG